MTCSPRHAHGASRREATVDGERTRRRETADVAMLAVRLAITVWELIRTSIDHAFGGPGRIL